MEANQSKKFKRISGFKNKKGNRRYVCAFIEHKFNLNYSFSLFTTSKE